MNVAILIILLALIWLAVETKGLTVRLPLPQRPPLKMPTGIIKMMLGWLYVVIRLALFGNDVDSIYVTYYQRWHDPVFHWLLKRERKNKEVPKSLHELAWNTLLLYRQMETEIGSEVF